MSPSQLDVRRARALRRHCRRGTRAPKCAEPVTRIWQRHSPRIRITLWRPTTSAAGRHEPVRRATDRARDTSAGRDGRPGSPIGLTATASSKSSSPARNAAAALSVASIFSVGSARRRHDSARAKTPRSELPVDFTSNSACESAGIVPDVPHGYRSMHSKYAKWRSFWTPAANGAEFFYDPVRRCVLASSERPSSSSRR